jgi:hypothetical protein
MIRRGLRTRRRIWRVYGPRDSREEGVGGPVYLASRLRAVLGVIPFHLFRQEAPWKPDLLLSPSASREERRVRHRCLRHVLPPLETLDEICSVEVLALPEVNR